MSDDNAQIVTSIEEHPRRRGRFVVSIADQPFATVPAESIATLQIRVDGVLALRALNALREHDRRTAVLDRALRLLAVRARATSELSRALLRAKDRPSADDVKWVIKTLTDQGYLDDVRFADQFVRDHAASRGWAKHRVKQELRRRGVAPADFEPALTQADEDAAIDDASAARAVAQKWRRTHAGREPERDRQRLYGFLARRGFAPDVIHAAMRAVLNDREADSR